MSNLNVSVKQNLKKTVSNLMGVIGSTLEVSSELVSDASGLAITAIKQIKPVTKEVIQSPLSAAKGYMMEQGVSEEEAQERAFACLEEDLASAIRKGAEYAGELSASLLEGWDEPELTAEEIQFAKDSVAKRAKEEAAVVSEQ